MNISPETKLVGKSRKHQSWLDYEERNNPTYDIKCIRKPKYK